MHVKTILPSRGVSSGVQDVVPLTSCPLSPPGSGSVLGPEGPEEGEPGPGGPAPRGHRVCRQRGSVGPHPELQEEPQLQLPGQVV